MTDSRSKSPVRNLSDGQQWIKENFADLTPTAPKKKETHQYVYSGNKNIPHGLTHIVRMSHRPSPCPNNPVVRKT